MEVHFTPDVQAKLEQMARQSGRSADKLVQDAVAGLLDSRYDDVKSGRVKPIDGEAFFETLRQREDELLKPS
jgi:hypothetical protein